MNTETNPGETPEVDDELEADDEGSPEAGTNDNSDEPEEGDEDSEDEAEETIEWQEDGKTFKVPAALKDHLLRQGDYTRKTQELAAERKELGALKESIQKAGEAEINAKAQMVAIDAAIQQYEGINWEALEAQNPQNAARLWRQYSQLGQAREQATKDYTSAVETRGIETQQEAAKRIEQGLAELQRDIPGWSVERAQQLAAFGVEQFGFTRENVESIDDPKIIKMLNYAFLATKQKPKQQAQPALQPAAKVRGGTSTPKTGLDDRLSTEEWVKRRNAQAKR
jgi:hypothetical protein